MSERHHLPADPGDTVERVRSRRPVWSLDLVKRAALVDPRRALRSLEHADPQERSAELLTVRAEAYLRIRTEDAAFTAAVDAVKLAVPGSEELIAAAAVMTDIACWIGQPDAVATCEDFADLAAVHDVSDLSICAKALGAVACYHWRDCRQARDALGRLAADCRRLGYQALLVMIDNALTVMALGCEPTGYTVDLSGWAPVPGGQLCQPADAWPQYLTSRLRRRPGTHTCRGSAASRGNRTGTGTDS